MPSWVYEIIQRETNKSIYIGSTTGKYFCLRKGAHTRPSNIANGRQPKLYNFINENGSWEHFHFIILREFENIEKDNLRIVEKEFIKEKSPHCNSVTPILTDEERKESKRLKSKKWRSTHPEYLQQMRLSSSNKKYIDKRCSTKIECECGGVYTLQNRSNHFSRQIHKRYEDAKAENETAINSEIT